MKLDIYQVDAFTGNAFSGNPAAVCLLPAAVLESMDDKMRQSVAAEMNLSETAFLEPVDPSSSTSPEVFQQHDTFKLRWFTPTTEVPLCGHATLASAATLFAECSNPASTLHFHTHSGTLSVSRKHQGDKSILQMSLPLSAALDPLPAPLLSGPSEGAAIAATAASSTADLTSLLTTNSGACRLLSCLLTDLKPGTATSIDAATAAPSSGAASGAQSAILPDAGWLAGVVEHIGYVRSLKYLLVVLKRGTGRAQLAALRPNFAGMEAAVSPEHMTGVIVTAQSEEGEDGGYDFYSRFLGPWAGIPEDPVTGSAHAVLGPYWAPVLGKQQLVARQVSQRGGDVWMDLEAVPGRVVVSGEAVVVMQAVLRLPDS